MEKLSHAIPIPNIYWNASVLYFNESEYDEYDEQLEQVGCQSVTVEHVLHTITFKSLTCSTHNLLLCSNLISTEEPTSFNLHLESLCGDMYPFIKIPSVKYKQSD